MMRVHERGADPHEQWVDCLSLPGAPLEAWEHSQGDSGHLTACRNGRGFQLEARLTFKTVR